MGCSNKQPPNLGGFKDEGLFFFFFNVTHLLIGRQGSSDHDDYSLIQKTLMALALT